jgi:hypothetical protein
METQGANAMNLQLERRRDIESRAAISACLADYDAILQTAARRKIAARNRDNRNVATWIERFNSVRNSI